MGALALHRSSRLPSDSGSQHNLDPKKGAHINLIRDAPFPEPSFICLSKGPVNEPPPVSLRGGPYGESCPFPEPSHTCLTHSSIKVLLIKKIFTLLLKALGKERPPIISKIGALWKQTSISRALFGISFGVPRKGAFPPGSPHRAPTERDAPFPEPSLIHISKFPVYEPPFTFPNN